MRIYHASDCRCNACRHTHLATPAEFRVRWVHKFALVVLGAVLAALYATIKP